MMCIQAKKFYEKPRKPNVCAYHQADDPFDLPSNSAKTYRISNDLNPQKVLLTARLQATIAEISSVRSPKAFMALIRPMLYLSMMQWTWRVTRVIQNRSCSRRPSRKLILSKYYSSNKNLCFG